MAETSSTHLPSYAIIVALHSACLILLKGRQTPRWFSIYLVQQPYHQLTMTKKHIIAFLFLLFMGAMQTFAQSGPYCFWVYNESDETFSTLRIRQSDTWDFGNDLLPNDLIGTGQYFWVRANDPTMEVWDVEITRLDGSPLRFTWTGENGQRYTEPYITLNIRELHTLVISNDEYGNISWDITDTDVYDFGHPCNQD